MKIVRRRQIILGLILYQSSLGVSCVSEDRRSGPGVDPDLSPLVHAQAPGAPSWETGAGVRAESHAFERGLLGVRFQLVLVGSDSEACAALAEDLFELVAAVESVANNWDPTSEVSRLNADPRVGLVTVSAELGELLQRALEYRELSGGGFDPSVGAILSAMGFYGGEQRLLAESELLEMRARVGRHALRLSPSIEGEPASLQRAERALVDLSGLAKGWAVDRAAALLRERGVERAFLSAGASTVYGLGAGPPGAARGWTFQVPDGQGLWETWWLVDEAVSTSGKLSMPLDPGGVRTSHLIDPRTCRPVEGPHAMSVFRGPSAAEADMASTALLVMGEARARALFSAGGAWGSERCAMLVDPDGQRLELGEIPRLLPPR